MGREGLAIDNDMTLQLHQQGSSRDLTAMAQGGSRVVVPERGIGSYFISAGTHFPSHN